ncbi:MAG: hypothetical protein C0515_05210 [Novosphingobium sp.]|nr:hypothetical protein [Novosphingobium sp.]
MTDFWLEFFPKIAWPLVALIAIFYIWKSDALEKLIRITDAVKDLQSKMSDLIQVEQRLSQTVESIGGMVSNLNELQGSILEMRGGIDDIRDLVDRPMADEAAPGEAGSQYPEAELRPLYDQIDAAWADLTNALARKFGEFDRRSPAAAVYRFAHGNRKGAKLDYEQADEISRLYSSIKSYRRRQNVLSEWLTKDVSSDFVESCEHLVRAVRKM